MSSSQRQAIITLIEKKGKDRNYLKNWRPISLTNVDAKIASKVIAARIIPVLPEIVTSTYTGYVKGSRGSSKIDHRCSGLYKRAKYTRDIAFY